MLRKSILLTVLAVLVCALPASAQEKHIEASLLLGWTFADGVSGNAVVAQDGNVYNRIDPKDSFKWGFDVGGYVTEHGQIGFLFSKQQSKLTVGGTNTKDVGDMGVYNYHGYGAYNFGEPDAKMRPYVMFGLGATHSGSVTFDRITQPGQGQTASNTRFSTTWGGGIKYFPGPSVGIRAGVQWTPTYIKSDATGYWCDPFWGCYLVGNAQYSNQFDLLGGVSFRF